MIETFTITRAGVCVRVVERGFLIIINGLFIYTGFTGVI